MGVLGVRVVKASLYIGQVLFIPNIVLAVVTMATETVVTYVL